MFVPLIFILILTARYDPARDGAQQNEVVLGMQSGPFTGEQRPAENLGQPLQTFPLLDGAQLEVYGPMASDPSATVLLRGLEGQVKWCVYATDATGTKLDSIQFEMSNTTEQESVDVIGLVTRNGILESTTWRVQTGGELVGYWFSW
jgi:hypothetical protein